MVKKKRRRTIKAFSNLSEKRELMWNKRPVPTPEEIAQRAAEIREGWTDREEELRRVGPYNMRIEARIIGQDLDPDPERGAMQKTRAALRAVVPPGKKNFGDYQDS